MPSQFVELDVNSSLYVSLQTDVMDLVHLMGGRVYLDLNVSVTHLIAGEVGSKKYLVAASLGKPVLQPSWVHACWEKSQDRYVDNFFLYLTSVSKSSLH